MVHPLPLLLAPSSREPVRGITIPDLVADPGLVQRLIDEGETLFVERKARDPKIGLGATVASFANMLGGWLLLGVDDDGNVVGYEPPGTADLQDHIRDLLRAQVDPLPPFGALSVSVREHTIGVVHVVESSDQPHITSEGVIYRRNPGGKERVTNASDIIAMAQRGDNARERAALRRWLPLIRNAMGTPAHIYGDDPNVDTQPPLLEWIVHATPYTVTGTFADRALTKHAAELARAKVTALSPEAGVSGGELGLSLEGRARGVYCEGRRRYKPQHTDMAIDAGGVIAARVAHRRSDDTITVGGIADGWLRPLITAVADVLRELDGYGRADVGLEVRGTDGLRVYWSRHESGGPRGESGVVLREEEAHDLHLDGELVIPATVEDVNELVDRWKRELARAARLEAWEPAPVPPAPPDDEP